MNLKLIFVITAVIFLGYNGFSQKAATVEAILNKAYNKAEEENKNVFLIFHASWCGWCKKLDASMNDVNIKKYFDDNYIKVYLTVQETALNRQLENPGAASFLQKYNGADAGLPFFMVLDKKGNFLGDSFVNAQNIGCPATENEIRGFISLLKQTSLIDDEGLEKISYRFKQNVVLR